jgi:hypothetical protein
MRPRPATKKKNRQLLFDACLSMIRRCFANPACRRAIDAGVVRAEYGGAYRQTGHVIGPRA